MKRSIFLSTLMLALCAWALPLTATAQDDGFFSEESTSKSKKSKKKAKDKKKKKSAEAEDRAEASVIGSALAEATYLTDARPNPHAKYYIILHSASWCGPCRMEMPKIAKEYPNMLASGKVELVLASADREEQKALEFVNSNNGTFPVIPKGALPELPNAPQIPGIPFASIYKADGTLVTSGHGSIVMNWREHTKTSAGAAADEGSETAVADALKKVTFLQGKPALKADYYIFLHSGSWCPPCRALMPKVVDEYKKLKRKKIELILVCAEKTEEEGKEYPKHYKAKFPAAMPAAMNGVPGYATTPSYPHAIIVDKTGRLIERGHGQIILNWKDIIKKDKAENAENE